MVTQLLAIHIKHTGMSISIECLTKLNLNLSDFWRQFITVIETLIYHFTPGINEKSKQWLFRGYPAPKRLKWLIQFHDNDVLRYMHYNKRLLPWNWKMTLGDYYVKLLVSFKNIIKRKDWLLAKENTLFNKILDAYTPMLSLWRYELLPNPSYSPDLNLSAIMFLFSIHEMLADGKTNLAVTMMFFAETNTNLHCWRNNIHR